MIEQVKLALQYGMAEDCIVNNLDISHLEFRRFCHKNNLPLDFSVITEGLAKEIQHLDGDEEWSRKRIAGRYFLKLTQVHAIMHNNYTIKKQENSHLTKLMLQDLVDASYSTEDIAKQFEISPYKVRQLLNQHGLHIKPNRSAKNEDLVIDMLLDEKPISEIIQASGLSYSTVYKIKRRHIGVQKRKKYNKVDTVDIERLHNQGYNQEEIANRLNISQATVSRKLACKNS